MHPLLLIAIILLAITIFGVVASRLTRETPAEEGVTIAAPRERVIAELEEIDRLPQWYSNIEEVSPGEKPGVHVQRWRDGTDRDVTVDRSGLPETLVWRYKVEPKIGEEPPAVGTWRFSFTPRDGDTHVDIDVKEEQSSPGFELFQFVRGRASDADLFLRELKDRIENPEETPHRAQAPDEGLSPEK
jgi:uncharacterized protein YndB with AHSA1/START domain